MGSKTATAACLMMIGGVPSPPMALEESSEVRAVKVSSSEILIEQKGLSGKEVPETVRSVFTEKTE